MNASVSMPSLSRKSKLCGPVGRPSNVSNPARRRSGAFLYSAMRRWASSGLIRSALVSRMITRRLLNPWVTGLYSRASTILTKSAALMTPGDAFAGRARKAGTRPHT